MKDNLDRRIKDRLSNVDDFVDFMGFIYERRESLIGEMYEAKTEELQQIAGKIIMCDEILQAGNWREIKARYQRD
jgi:hypothetical protein